MKTISGTMFAMNDRHGVVQIFVSCSTFSVKGGSVGGQTRVDLATLAFFPCFFRVFCAGKRRKSH